YEKRGDEWRIIERVCVHEGTHSAPVNAMEFDTSNFRQEALTAPQPGDQLGHEWVSSRATIALITTMVVTWLTTASGA
mgnify:CR=1